MKILVFLLILTGDFCAFSQSQIELNQNAHDEFKIVDSELNSVYKLILTKFKSDSIFIDKLKKSQRLWVSFRDAEIEALFPASDKQGEYGSIYPMCISIHLKELTDLRIITLRKYLIGIHEGDVCSGQLPILESLDSTNLNKLIIDSENNIDINPNIKKDYRIFGYSLPSLDSKKVILFSVFTNDVDKNPYALKNGAYYSIEPKYNLKLISQHGDFYKIDLYFESNYVDSFFIHSVNFQ